MQLYVVRHGESLVNIKGSVTDNVDLGLTHTGHAQAAKLAQWLGVNVPQVDVIFASSMRRAQETAQHIEQVYGQDCVIDHRLRELGNNYADHSPIPTESLPRDYGSLPKYIAPFHPVALDVPKTESWVNFRMRVSHFVEDVAAEYFEKTVLVIGHGGVINAVLDHVMNIPMWRRCEIRCQHTSVTYLEYYGVNEYEPWRLNYVGLFHHLIS